MAIRHNAAGDKSRSFATACSAITGMAITCMAIGCVTWCCVAAAVAAPDGVTSARRQRGAHSAPAAKRMPRPALPPAHPAPPVVIEQPPAPPPELPPVDLSTPPPSLPRAPRERMKLCATQWLKLRQERQTGGTTWREFATQCLAR